MYEISYSNGRSDETDILSAALDTLRKEYPDAVFFADDGFEVDYGEPDATDMVAEELRTRKGARVLCWDTGERSKNDDGARAVASIRWEP